MKKCILALDQGTSSSRAIVYDEEFHILSTAQKEFTQIYKNNGWVEHDPNEIWESQLSVAKAAIKMAGEIELVGIGITNQRETTIVWDKNTGEPVYNAIVWMCRRTSDYCSELIENGYADMIKEKTGLIIDPYFSATKIHWILENVPGAKERAEKGELYFGTVDSWLLYKLTEGKVHATDYTNAARTMLFNIFDGEYDEDLLKLFDVPESMLPEVYPSNAYFGETTIFGGNIPISGIAGDQHASLFGNHCFHKGMAKNTYGTGCFTLIQTGTEPKESKNGLLTTIAYNLGGETYYALEGSVFNAGSTVQWLRDELQIIESSAQSEEFAKKVPDTGDVYLVPAFSGLGAPYWDMYARGIMIGMTRSTNKYHITRAVLESIAYQTADVLSAMEQDCGEKITTLRADGGASRNAFLMQFQSDILGCEVVRAENPECTSLGAAYLAAMGCGLIKELPAEMTGDANRFVPKMAEDDKNTRLAKWHKAIEKCKAWAD